VVGKVFWRGALNPEASDLAGLLGSLERRTFRRGALKVAQYENAIGKRFAECV
jgi:hypothetical protein